MKHIFNQISRIFFAGMLVLTGCMSIVNTAHAVPVVIGYDYEIISGGVFDSVIAPSNLADTEFDLIVGGSSYLLTGGTEFSFTALDPLGFSAFTISGIDPGLLLDPTNPFAFVTGLTFTNLTQNGLIAMSQTPIVIDYDPNAGNNVPEPATLALMCLGLAAIGLSRNRKAT